MPDRRLRRMPQRQGTGHAYQQDIHYYGIATDARYLKPACEQQYKGVWMER